MYSFTRLWVFATSAAILCVAGVLGGATSCDKCSCERVEIVSSRRSILYVNCSKSGVSENVPIPNLDSYNYTEIRAEFERNKITTVQYAIFKGIPITYLNLGENEIRNIAVGSLAKMPELKELNLSKNKLTETLNSKVFQGLEKLEILDLSENGILNLESTVFYSLQSLKTLKLSKNFFKEIPSDLFMSVRNLEVLHLQQNALTSINKVTFHTLDMLNHLDVSGNSLVTLDEDIFEVSTHLVTLNLSNNNLTSLSPNIFKVLKRLEVLNLGRNSLRGLGKEFPLPKSLKVLDIGHNHIKDAGLLFQDFDDLRELHAEDNDFDKIDVVTALTKLQVLNISSNRLKTFPLQTYPLLRVLDLSDNLFPSIPPVVTGQYLPSLNHLTLDANPISQIKFPATKSTFFNLTYVSLSKLPALREIPARAFTTLVSRGTARYEFKGAMIDEEFIRKRRTLVSRGTHPEPELTRKKRDTTDINIIPDADEASPPEGTLATSALPPVDITGSTTEAKPDPTGLAQGSGNLPTDEQKQVLKFIVPAGVESVSENTGSGNQPNQQVVDDIRGIPAVAFRDNKEVDTKDVDESEDGLKKMAGVSESTKEVGESEVGLKKTMGIRESKEVNTNTKEVVENEQRGIVSREVVDEERNLDDERKWTMESEEGERLGSLRKEPGLLVAVSNVRQYENVHVAGDCRAGLTLRVAMNKNLMKIHADAFKGVEICELDLSSNSLTSLPENVLDWSAVRSVDIQRNPWDCSCKLQWLLNIIVPKLYKERPELLYELRCATPAMLFERRFVHFFNWTEPAFCIEHKYEQIKKVINGTEVVDESISFGSSNGMLIAVGFALFLIVLMIAMGLFYQWRVANRRRRIKNRRG